MFNLPTLFLDVKVFILVLLPFSIILQKCSVRTTDREQCSEKNINNTFRLINLDIDISMIRYGSYVNVKNHANHRVPEYLSSHTLFLRIRSTYSNLAINQYRRSVTIRKLYTIHNQYLGIINFKCFCIVVYKSESVCGVKSSQKSQKKNYNTSKLIFIVLMIIGFIGGFVILNFRLVLRNTKELLLLLVHLT